MLTLSDKLAELYSLESLGRGLLKEVFETKFDFQDIAQREIIQAMQAHDNRFILDSV